jgi:formylglycine-generating enzyme required for sulfatase activity
LAQKLAGAFEFVQVPGGSFEMGDTFGDGNSDEQPVHEVQVDSFSIGKFPVTQGQWQMVLGGNPSCFILGENCPVNSVNWNDVQAFITKLNQLTGKAYRLPTEAEWEYAARSCGKQEKWAGTSEERELAEYALYDNVDFEDSDDTTKVGMRKPNGLGIYDMCGTVWEWCSDWYGEDYYSHSVKVNPPGASSGMTRVIRGGSFYDEPRSIRVASRFNLPPAFDGDDSDLGFRLVLPSSASSK